MSRSAPAIGCVHACPYAGAQHITRKCKGISIMFQRRSNLLTKLPGLLLGITSSATTSLISITSTISRSRRTAKFMSIRRQDNFLLMNLRTLNSNLQDIIDTTLLNNTLLRALRRRITNNFRNRRIIRQDIRINRRLIRDNSLNNIAQMTIRSPTIFTIFLNRAVLSSLINRKIEGRLTLINMTRHLGARFNLIFSIMTRSITNKSNKSIRILNRRDDLNTLTRTLKTRSRRARNNLLLYQLLVQF